MPSLRRGSEPLSLSLLSLPPNPLLLALFHTRPLSRLWPSVLTSSSSPPHPLSSLSQVNADVQATHVRVTAKKNTLQLVLPSEVLMDSSKAERSSTTGHLLLTCPKLHPVTTSKAPSKHSKKKDTPAALPQPTKASGGLLEPPKPNGEGLKGAVDVKSIVKTSPNGNGGTQTGEPQPALVPTLGPDFDDESEVPPLL